MFLLLIIIKHQKKTPLTLCEQHTKPTLNQSFRGIFCCDEKSHAGHMKAVTQSVLDGTSKWSAKIAITGLSPKSL